MLVKHFQRNVKAVPAADRLVSAIDAEKLDEFRRVARQIREPWRLLQAAGAHVDVEQTARDAELAEHLLASRALQLHG